MIDSPPQSSLHPETGVCPAKAGDFESGRGRRGAGIRTAATVTGVGVVLGLCLFGDTVLVCAPRVIHTWDAFPGSLFRAVSSLLITPATQWIVALCLGMYLVPIVLCRAWSMGQAFWRVNNPDLWLIPVVAVGAGDYAANYPAASLSTSFLVFLTGVVLAQGVKIWSGRPGSEKALDIVLTVLMIFLAIGSLWDAQLNKDFKYRGHLRVSGPWESPNYYGLFMGVGILIAAAKIMSALGHSKEQEQTGQQKESWAGKYGLSAACGLGALLMAWGLFRSYSRGAWLATLCGFGYLWLPILRRHLSKAVFRLRGLLLPSALILLSAGVLVFWTFRQTEWRPARRVFSMANANDFSWRNRVTAWEGALSMMAERPWAGFGWNQVEPMYHHYYSHVRMEETGAISSNDFLYLGATMGLPVLCCFLAYISLSLAQKPVVDRPVGSMGLSPHSAGRDWLHAVCGAGVIVFLVGFWFDSGLFKLPTAATFWILLALASNRRKEAET